MLGYYPIDIIARQDPRAEPTAPLSQQHLQPFNMPQPLSQPAPHRPLGSLARLLLSAALAALFASLAMFAAWTFAAASGLQVVSPAPRALYRVQLDRQAVSIAASSAAAVWLAIVLFLWWPRRTHDRPRRDPILTRSFRRAAIATAALALIAGLLLYQSSRLPLVSGDRSWLTAAAGLFVLAALCQVWFDPLRLSERGRPILAAGERAAILCPNCSYDMGGLSTLTCPECGRGYTVDELINAQAFALPPAPPKQPAEARPQAVPSTK